MDADAVLSERHDGIGEGDGVDSFLEKAVGELDGLGTGVVIAAEHDGGDGMYAGEDVEAEFFHALAECFGVFF